MLNSYIRLAVCHHLMPLSRPTRLRGFMKELEERIAQQGTVKPGNVLKVDAFLNQKGKVLPPKLKNRMDVQLKK